MSFTSSDLTQIERAIVSLSAGESAAEVTFSSGNAIKYREADLDKLIKLRSLIQSEIGGVHRRVYARNAGRCRT